MGVKIYAEFLDFMMGKIDWQDMVNRVAKSMDNKVAELIVKQIESAYTGLDTKYVQSGSYDEDIVESLEASIYEECMETPFLSVGAPKEEQEAFLFTVISSSLEPEISIFSKD